MADFDLKFLLEGLRQPRDAHSAKAIKPERVWSAAKRRFVHHPDIDVSSEDVGESSRELHGTVGSERSRANVTKAMDDLMAQYGATPSVTRDKWSKGRKITRNYRAGQRFIAVVTFSEDGGAGEWRVSFSVPKR